MTKTSSIALTIACILGLAATASAALYQATPRAARDAMIFGTSADADTGNASGVGPGLFAGADGSLNKKRSLVYFDLSALGGQGYGGADPDVQDVELDLWLGQIAGSGGGGGPGGGCGMSCTYPSRTYYLHRVETDWTEGTTGFPTSTTMGGTGQGWSFTACNCHDVSWDNTDYTSSLPITWSTAGTAPYQDFDATADATETFTAPFTLGTVQAFVGSSTHNPAMAQTVEDWISAATPNYGWEILSSSTLEASQASFLGWWSRDGSLARLSNLTEAPLLIINYN